MCTVGVPKPRLKRMQVPNDILQEFFSSYKNSMFKATFFWKFAPELLISFQFFSIMFLEKVRKNDRSFFNVLFYLFTNVVAVRSVTQSSHKHAFNRYVIEIHD